MADIVAKLVYYYYCFCQIYCRPSKLESNMVSLVMDIPCFMCSPASDKLMIKAMQLLLVVLLARFDPIDFDSFQ